MRRDVEDIFLGLGYEIVDGREVETTRYNFDALGFPDWHPARSPRDVALSSTTTRCCAPRPRPAQIHKMEAQRPPIYMVSIGRVYRRDTIDATHYPIFHQFEGLAIDKGITMADLKGTLLYVMRAALRPRAARCASARTTSRSPSRRWSPTSRARSAAARAAGPASTRAGSRWAAPGWSIPCLYEFVGWGPEEYTGFAFGMGIERTAQLRHGIPGIRAFWDNDLRFLRQF